MNLIFKVQFPEDYSLNPDMSGVVADFHIVLNKIYTSEVPELTDEWVKENSEESETVDEYKEERSASSALISCWQLKCRTYLWIR